MGNKRQLRPVLGSGGSWLGRTPSFESGEEAGMGIEWPIVMLSPPTRISQHQQPYDSLALCLFQDVASGAQSDAEMLFVRRACSRRSASSRLRAASGGRWFGRLAAGDVAANVACAACIWLDPTRRNACSLFHPSQVISVSYLPLARLWPSVSHRRHCAGMR